MSRFDDFPLSWMGRDYLILSRNIMGAIARVEDHVTLVELQQYASRGTTPLGKVSAAYASLLNYAGARVTAEDVYAGMFGEDNDANQEAVQIALMGLMELMVPPSLRGNRIAQPAAPTPAPATPPKPAVVRSLKKPSRSASRSRRRAG